MRLLQILWTAAALAGAAFPVLAADESADQIAIGKHMAETYCSGCHATGVKGQSPRKEAPLFRQLGRRYALEDLQEALAEGIAVGHPDMPQFEFSPEQGDALIAYLKSIQTAAPKRR